MKKGLLILIAILGCLVMVSLQSVSAQNWPQWRGPMGTGVAEKGNPPVEWSEEKNIRWKTRLPGIGASTPVIWGNNIFVTGAKPAEIDSESRMKGKFSRPVKYTVTAIDRISGKIKWERLAMEEIPHEGKHVSIVGGHNSPCTDGERVYAYFGSRGLYCYTIEGDLLWEKDCGDKHIAYGYGEGSSPALYKDRLIVNWDHVGQSFIVVLDAATGKELWRVGSLNPEGNEYFRSISSSVADSGVVVAPYARGASNARSLSCLSIHVCNSRCWSFSPLG